MSINILEPRVYNRISAGEVVERPASIVKELVENSIDAGSKNIRIEITGGGIESITVADDGCGIEKEDLTVAFMPHATSKIKDVDDLDEIATLGFRGEALASISSVTQVKLSSKTKNSPIGYSISVDGGNVKEVTQTARTDGTTITCSNLFFNTPVRAKFLRKPKTEESEITHLVEKFMLSHSEIAFAYYVDGKQIYNTKSCSMQDIIYTIYGSDVYDNLIKVDYEEAGYRIEGFVTKPKISKSNRTYQTLFVNGRYVENYLISNAVSGVYENFLMKGKFPVYVLNITLPLDCVDVNVHPTKREVKFENPNRIFGMVRKAVENALLSVDQIATYIFEDKSDYEFKNLSVSSNVELTSEFNMQGADPMYKMNDEKLSYGRSFSLDHEDTSKPMTSPEEFEIKIEKKDDGIIETNVNVEDRPMYDPQNASIKGMTRNKSTLYFDQTNNRFLNELRTESKPFLTASVKDDMKILGTLFKTYIVIELYDSVYFIDQHAGSERLLYDKLLKQVDQGIVARQDLMLPYTFTVGAIEGKFVDRISESLREIGFDIEKSQTNQNQYLIKSVPLALSNIELDKFTEELLREDIGYEKKASDFIHEKLCQTACKHAIKAGDQISKDDCAYIIENVRKGVMLCPHGRPITLEITKTQFEKMFKRIV